MARAWLTRPDALSLGGLDVLVGRFKGVGGEVTGLVGQTDEGLLGLLGSLLALLGGRSVCLEASLEASSAAALVWSAAFWACSLP